LDSLFVIDPTADLITDLDYVQIDPSVLTHRISPRVSLSTHVNRYTVCESSGVLCAVNQRSE